MTPDYVTNIEYDAEGPGYVVSVSALPGCFTQGANVPEAIERAREAIAGHVAALRDLGQDVSVEEMPALMTIIEVEKPTASKR